MKKYIHLAWLGLVLIASISVSAQYIIKGKVTDAVTNEAIPFVVIQLKGTTVGAQTDFDGKFTLKTNVLKDSIKATYVGYKVKTRPLKDLPVQEINIQMTENTTELNEIVVKRGENPAWEIIRRANNNRFKNDQSSLNGLEYESYTKVQIDIDNLSSKLRKKKLMRKIVAAIDSMKKVTNDEGKAVLPIYISETISNVYQRTLPKQKKETIVGQKITGIVDGSNANFLSQLTGSTTTEFDLYQNWVRFLGKDFVSPVSDSWRDYYEYDLEDSVNLGSDYCYKINIKPKRPADLAFKGIIWITKNEYAIKQTDLTIGKSANLNFIEKIKLQQESEKTATGPWVPKKVRFLIDVAELGDSSAGLLVKYYISNKNIVENKPKPSTFFDVGIEVDENATFQKEDYWTKNRHDSLSQMDKQVFKMVDTLRNLPTVKTYIEIVDILVNGHKKVGFLEFGPYISMFAYNNIEGLRMRMGVRTNMKFHKRLQLKGWAAYGTLDQRVKGGGGFEYWFSKKKWFLFGADYSYELEQISLFSNFRAPGSGLFYAFARTTNFMDRQSPLYVNNASFHIQMDVLKGFTQKIQFNYQVYNRVENYNNYSNFGYYNISGDTNSGINNSLVNSEILLETRLARQETYYFIDHRRISYGTSSLLPIVTFRAQLGFKGLFGANYTYQKYSLNLYQKVTVGKFGQSMFSLTGSYVPYTLPYPLLNVHLGNQTLFYNSTAFSMMRFFEFVSDKSISLNYQHHFNGFFFNRIPLFSRLKWREVVSANVLWGSVSNQNLALTPNKPLEYRSYLGLDPNIPYVDVGFGIENIFKFLRVEAYRRVNYLDVSDDVRSWGIKIGAALSL